MAPSKDNTMENQFDSIRQHANSKIPAQQNQFKLLNAIEETLDSQSPSTSNASNTKSRSSTAYFAATLSTIQQLVQAQEQREDLIIASLYLFAIILPHTQVPVIRSQSSVLNTLLPTLLSDFLKDAGATKSLLSLFPPIFKAYGVYSTGGRVGQEQGQLLALALQITVDDRPKVRRKAADVVKEIVSEAEDRRRSAEQDSSSTTGMGEGQKKKGGVSTAEVLASYTVEFIISTLSNIIESSGGSFKRNRIGAASGPDTNATKAIALLSFSKSILPYWPATDSSSTMASFMTNLLNLPRLGNPFLTSSAYTLLESLFERNTYEMPASSAVAVGLNESQAGKPRPDGVAGEGTKISDVKIRETFFALLGRDAEGNEGSGVELPDVRDEVVMPAYLGAVEAAVVAVARTSPKTLSSFLSDIFSSTLAFVSSPAASIRVAATSCLEAILRWGVNDEMILDAVKASAAEEADSEAPSSKKGKKKSKNVGGDAALGGMGGPLVDIVKSLLFAPSSIQFRGSSLPHVFDVLASLIARLRYRSPAFSSLPSPAIHRTKGDPRPPTAASILLRNHVRLVGSIRSQPGFEYRENAEKVLKKAAEVCGPVWLLDVVPLNLGFGESPKRDDETEGGGRAWLLPMMKGSISNTVLGHFVSFFLPLSSTIFEAKKTLDEAKNEGRGTQAKIYEALIEQIWALFPGYCDLPVDLAEHLSASSSLLQTLSNVLYATPSLRPPVLRGLSLLITRNQTLAKASAPQTAKGIEDPMVMTLGVNQSIAEKNLQLLRGQSANILGVLFNVFSTCAPDGGKGKKGGGGGGGGEGGQGRGEVLECIGVWLGALEAKDLLQTFEKVRGLLQQGLQQPTTADSQSSSTPVTHTMLDLLIAIVPFADTALVGPLFTVATRDDLLVLSSTGKHAAFTKKLQQQQQQQQAAVSMQVDGTTNKVEGKADPTIQKKAYRILARLCETDVAKVYLLADGGSRIEQLLGTLVDKTEGVSPAAKRDRTLLLSLLSAMLPQTLLHLVPSLLPEAVLGIKESNERTREASFELLVTMAKKMEQGGVIRRSLIKGLEDEMADEAPASLQEYFTMVAAGLAGQSPHMISATITAMSRLLFEFHADLPSSTVNDLLETIDVFLTSANREIVKSAVGFVKVAVVCLNPETVRPYLSTLVPSLLNWSHQNANQFKTKIRHIFERLIRRFGADELEKLVGDDDRKLITNIRKRQQRAKRRKDESKAEQDNEDVQPEVPQPKTMQSAFDDALYGSESESEDEGKGKARKEEVAAARPTKGLRRKPTDTYLHEDEDEPLDLLDEKAMGRIRATEPSQQARRRKQLGEDAAKFKTDESGRLIVDEGDNSDAVSDDDDGGFGPRGDSTNAYLEAIKGEDGFTRDARGRVKFNKAAGKGAKRSRREAEEDEQAEAALAAENHGGDSMDVDEVRGKLARTSIRSEGASGSPQKKAKKDSVKLGAEFKAKRAGGDVKKGGVSPYAYVPLSGGAGKKKGAKMELMGKKKKQH